MRTAWRIAGLLVAAAGVGACDSSESHPCTMPGGDGTLVDHPPNKLSGYCFFDVAPGVLTPRTGVVPYDLNTPLFSDYALKYRFIFVPPGKSGSYSSDGAFDFPVGTIFAKTFAFPPDFRQPDQNVKLLETRILVHASDGWKGLPYIWNDAQTDATLQITGATPALSWIAADGTMVSTNYLIPDSNQCKSCHADGTGAHMGLLGPKARNLNRDYAYADGSDNQLTRWSALGIVAGAPASASDAPRTPPYDDPTAGSLDARARGYLDVNCAHCHNPSGRAGSSGLYLDIAETVPAMLGRCKLPIAAGLGSGSFQYDVVPGSPDTSIVVYRMSSTEPGIRMPELGRTVVHKEGVQLIRDWIAAESPPGCM